MALIGRLIDKLLKKGTVTVITAAGKRATYGRGGGKHLTLRLTDAKAPLEILRNPRLGLGETYMDGRLVIEDGTMLDLFELITGERLEDCGRARRLQKSSRQAKASSPHRPSTIASNVAHIRLSDGCTQLPLRRRTVALITPPRQPLEQAQSDRKPYRRQARGRSLAALLESLRLGGMALYLHRCQGGVLVSPVAALKSLARAEEPALRPFRFE